MIKDRLLPLLGDIDAIPRFAPYKGLLSAQVLRFPDEATLPSDPNASYGQGWHSRFRLPQSPVGVEDSQSLIILEDSKPNVIGLDEERRFLFIQPLPRPMFPVDFYLAWGVCSISFTVAPVRLNARVVKKGEWVVSKPDSEHADVVQSTFSAIPNPWQEKCESMICPGVQTAFEQLAYLAKK